MVLYVVLAMLQAEGEESFEPRGSRPVWTKETSSQKKKNNNVKNFHIRGWRDG